MEFKEVQKKENKVLHRTEITAKACFEGPTPSNVDIKKGLAKQAAVDAKLCLVKHVYTHFGETCADVLMFTYDSMEHFMKVERLKEEPKDEQKQKEDAATAAEAPAEVKEEAAPAEESKTEEEKPVEETESKDSESKAEPEKKTEEKSE